MGYCKECPVVCCRTIHNEKIVVLAELFEDERFSALTLSYISKWVAIYYYDIPPNFFLKRWVGIPDRASARMETMKPDNCPKRTMAIGGVLKR